MSKAKPCPLTNLPSGCKAKVIRVVGGPAERGRLCSLGLTPSTPVDVLDNSSGRQVVKVRGCNIVLDETLSVCIICERSE